RDCLKKTNISRLPDGKFDDFVCHIEESIKTFRSIEPTATERETRDALYAIYWLAHEEDLNLALLFLFAQLQMLPQRALEYLNYRAALSIPKLFPGEVADKGFLEWAKGTKDDEYVSSSVPEWEFVEQAITDNKRGTRAGKI